MSLVSSLFKNVLGNSRVRVQMTKDEILALLVEGRLDDAALAIERLSTETPDLEQVKACLQGELAFKRFNDAAAEAHFRGALARSPGFADAHHGLSLLFHARGEARRALTHALFASLSDASVARFSAHLGLCQIDAGNFRKAKIALTRAIRLEPRDKWSWNNLGIARRGMGNFSAAAAAFNRALAVDPNFQVARDHLAMVTREMEAGTRATAKSKYQADQSLSRGDGPGLARVHEIEDAGDPEAAIRACETLVRAQPDEGALVVELARLHELVDEPQLGIDALEAYLWRFPDHPEAIRALGLHLVRNQEERRALPHVHRALALQPNDVPLLLAMADILFAQSRHMEAGDFLDRAYRIDPSPRLQGQLMASLCARCRYIEAIDIMDAMEADDPSVGVSLIPFRIDANTYLGRHDEVLRRVAALIDERPNDASMRFARANIKLLNEDFETGWEDYSFRHIQDSANLRVFPYEPWEGQPLAGKSILIAAEQGLGDQIMFASCLGDLLALGPSRVVLEVHERVYATMARSFPACEVVSSKQDRTMAWASDLGAMDYYVLIADLARKFRRSIAAFPKHQGYIKADERRVAHWRARIDAVSQPGRKRIGLSWRGGTESTKRVLRSFDMATLHQLVGGLDATLVSLQYGSVDDDLRAAEEAGLALHHWPEAITDLDEFAAIIQSLDLVVTVCNTTVHFAGSLGKPVWVLAPSVPEWRYGLNSTTMAWYPSSSVFRQSSFAEWTGVIERVRANIENFAAGKG